jgi:parvulin-like peptidyl-prolyl isomerase
MRNQILLILLLATARMFSADDPAAPKSIVLNGEKIPQSIVDEFHTRSLLMFKANAAAREPDAKMQQVLLRQARAQAVQQTMIKQYVAKNNIVATPQAIERELKQIRTDMEIAGFSLDLMLKERGKTLEDFSQEVSPSAALRQSCYNALDLAKLKKDFERRKDAVPRRRASHVLFMHSESKDKTVSKRLPAEARRLAQEALTRVRNGEEFSAIARECSDCPSASQGGDLGWFIPSSMVKPFSEAVYAMAKVGDVTPVIETEFGYHVIRLTGLLSTDEEAWQAHQKAAADALFQETLQRVIKQSVLTEE